MESVWLEVIVCDDEQNNRCPSLNMTLYCHSVLSHRQWKSNPQPAQRCLSGRRVECLGEQQYHLDPNE